MREQDKGAFRDAAGRFGFWIFVREPNPHSQIFIGKHGYRPKPIECKAKTADQPVEGPRRLEVAGLVVSPRVLRTAFSPERYEKAMSSWRDFAPGDRLPASYEVDLDRDSDHYGCVRLNKLYLYADYDLYAIVDPVHSHRFVTRYERLRGQEHRVDPRYTPVIEYLNSRIEEKLGMVQHHSLWQGGHHQEDTILYFGPKREEGTRRGRGEIAEFFEETFGLHEHVAPWEKG